MAANDQPWKQLGTDPLIATCAYSFGAGIANALAVGIPGGLAVVSPPCKVADAAFDAISAIGRVRALVASNAFHHLGLPEWKSRFPDAALFAPAQAIKRVAAKTGLAGIQPLSESRALIGDRVEFIDMPHYKTGEVLVKIRTSGGLAWYVTDAILNLPSLPAHPVFRLLFRLSGSAPGLRLNRVAPVFMVKDRTALWDWLRAEAQRDPPRWFIPAHGETLDLAATPTRLRELFDAA